MKIGESDRWPPACPVVTPYTPLPVGRDGHVCRFDRRAVSGTVQQILLFIGNHALDCGGVGHIGVAALAQAPLDLGGLTVAVEQMALEGVGALDLAVFGQVEALFRAAVGFQFRHSRLSPLLFSRCRGGLGGLSRQENAHVPSVQLRLLVQGGHFSTLGGEVQQQALADVGVGHFTAAEADGDLDPVTLQEEFLGVSQLHIEVAGVDTGGHTDLLDLHHMLVLFGLLVPFGLLKFEFSVIHELANGRDGVGGNLDQVHTRVIGVALGLRGGHDAELRAVRADQADLAVTDLLIDLMRRAGYLKAPPQITVMRPEPRPWPVTGPGRQNKARIPWYPRRHDHARAQ